MGEDEEEDDELDDHVNLFEALCSFFLSPSQNLSSILWAPILVELNLAGIIQLQNIPTTHHKMISL